MTGRDVIVVGGGVVGCAIALRLRQSGRRVLVLEKAIPGAEASSAAAGMLSAQAHEDEGGPTHALALRSAALHAPLAAELAEATGLDVGYRRTGALFAAFDEAGLERLAGRVRWQTAKGLRAETIGAAGARTLEPSLSEAATGGAFFPDEAQVDSPVFARALSLAAAAAGAEFAGGSPVRRVIVERERAAGVETAQARHEAPIVVIAAGAWSSLVEGAGLAPGTVRPARGQIVALETRPPLVRRVLWSDRGYVVPRADGRVICGSTVEDVGFHKAVTAQGVSRILAAAMELCPPLATAPIAATWSGFRPVTDDALPIIGWGRVEGLLFATGHFTSGILLAPATAEAVAALVAGGAPPVDVSRFSPRRFA